MRAKSNKSRTKLRRLFPCRAMMANISFCLLFALASFCSNSVKPKILVKGVRNSCAAFAKNAVFITSISASRVKSRQYKITSPWSEMRLNTKKVFKLGVCNWTINCSANSVGKTLSWAKRAPMSWCKWDQSCAKTSLRSMPVRAVKAGLTKETAPRWSKAIKPSGDNSKMVDKRAERVAIDACKCSCKSASSESMLLKSCVSCPISSAPWACKAIVGLPVMATSRAAFARATIGPAIRLPSQRLTIAAITTLTIAIRAKNGSSQ